MGLESKQPQRLTWSTRREQGTCCRASAGPPLSSYLRHIGLLYFKVYTHLDLKLLSHRPSFTNHG
jgi:hypothetical protein